jgi:hypothetical protein
MDTTETKQSLYQACLAAGLTVDNHYSDLYVMDGWDTRAMLRDYQGVFFTRFVSQVDGKIWLDIPFAYDPYWIKRGM